jgi:hypothetical protein
MNSLKLVVRRAISWPPQNFLSRLYNHLYHRMTSVRAPFRLYTLFVVYRNHGNLKLSIYNNYKAPAQLSPSTLVYIVETFSC